MLVSMVQSTSGWLWSDVQRYVCILLDITRVEVDLEPLFRVGVIQLLQDVGPLLAFGVSLISTLYNAGSRCSRNVLDSFQGFQ